MQDLLEYRKKQRVLRVKMLDGTIKTVLVCWHVDGDKFLKLNLLSCTQVDDSQTVAEITKTVCARIGMWH